MVWMAFVFIAILIAGVPVFIALAGASFIYTHFIAGMPDFSRYSPLLAFQVS